MFGFRIFFPFSFILGLKNFGPGKEALVHPNKCSCILKLVKPSPHECQKKKKKKELLTRKW